MAHHIHIQAIHKSRQEDEEGGRNVINGDLSFQQVEQDQAYKANQNTDYFLCLNCGFEEKYADHDHPERCQ